MEGVAGLSPYTKLFRPHRVRWLPALPARRTPALEWLSNLLRGGFTGMVRNGKRKKPRTEAQQQVTRGLKEQNPAAGSDGGGSRIGNNGATGKRKERGDKGSSEEGESKRRGELTRDCAHRV